MIYFLILILIFQVPALIPTIMESLKVVRLDNKNQSQATGKFLTIFWMGFESVHRETLKIGELFWSHPMYSYIIIHRGLKLDGAIGDFAKPLWRRKTGHFTT